MGTGPPNTELNQNKVVGVYTLGFSEPAYDHIQGGAWQQDEPFVVIHRLATTSGRGVGSFILRHVMKEHPYIRIDTHRDNKPMCQLLEKLGFVYCGTVFYDRPGGGERVAYDYVAPEGTNKNGHAPKP